MTWTITAFEHSAPGPEPKVWHMGYLVHQNGIDPHQPPEDIYDRPADDPIVQAYLAIHFCEDEQDAEALRDHLEHGTPYTAPEPSEEFRESDETFSTEEVLAYLEEQRRKRAGT